MSELKNIDGLSEMSQLQNLVLWRTKVSDLSSLSNLKELCTLDIDYTQIEDASPLLGLSKLRFLSAKDVPLSNVDLLAKRSTLEIHTGEMTYNECDEIDLHVDWQAWYWSRQLSIPEDEFCELVSKWGGSAKLVQEKYQEE